MTDVDDAIERANRGELIDEHREFLEGGVSAQQRAVVRNQTVRDQAILAAEVDRLRAKYEPEVCPHCLNDPPAHHVCPRCLRRSAP